MNLRQFLLILRLRWILVVIVALIAVGVTAFVNIRAPKVYTSQTALLLDVKADPLVATFMPAIASPAFLATQSHIIKSDKVAANVVKRLGFAQDRDAVARWKSATNGKVPLDLYYASMMQRGLLVEPAPGTSVLNISFTASDARFASIVANAYAQAYIDFSVDLRVEPARQYATWFDSRLKELRAELNMAKERLATAQQANGQVSTDVRADEGLTKLNTLEAQLASAVAERTELAVRARNSGSESSPDVQNNPMVQVLKSQLGKLEADFADARAKYGEGHPQYQQIVTQLAVVRQQLATEVRRVSSTSSTSTAISDQKVNDLRNQVEQQKKRVFGMRAGKDEVEVMAREVEATQRAYDAVAQRRTQLTLESQSDQAGARILSVAVEPLAPSKPKVLINILLSVVGGLAAGAALACGIELLDRRIRSSSDLTQIEGLPVLAVLNNNRPTFLGTTSLPLPAMARRLLIAAR